MDEKSLNQSDIEKINKKLIESLENYKKTLSYMAGDAPIQVLCLPKVIETVLINNGILRIYDLFNCDFTKIKGLGEARIKRLTSSLGEFISVS